MRSLTLRKILLVHISATKPSHIPAASVRSYRRSTYPTVTGSAFAPISGFGSGCPSPRVYSSTSPRQPHRIVRKASPLSNSSKLLELWRPKVSLSGARKMSTTAMANGMANGTQAAKPVFFFDIDNCLYSRSAKVHDRMSMLIDAYFAKHLNLPAEEATRLHREYYTNYGLAIEGLVRHHEIDPLDYNAQVDDALPLEDIIKPDPELRRLLEDIDKNKVTMWLFTNAYVNHGQRVVKLLGVEDLFEGLTYCDYSKPPLLCKPSMEMYKKAMREAGVDRFEDCYFVDDSFMNCAKAEEIGWTVVHLVEDDVPALEKQACKHQIKSLQELRDIFPHIFKSRVAVDG